MKDTLSPQTSGLIDLGKLTAIWLQRQVPGAIELTPPVTLGPNTIYGLPWCKTELKLSTEVDSATNIWVYSPDSYRLSLIVSCKRGVLWKGTIDIEFANVTQEHDLIEGSLKLKYQCSVICGSPEIGIDICNCV